MVAVSAGVVAPIVGAGEPVGVDQGAVEDRVRQLGDTGHGLSEAGCGGGEQVDGLADVAPGGGGTDAEPGREAGGGIAVTQVGKDE